jgi:hypothetical protein
MSKFRYLLGGLAAIGLFAALALSSVHTASATPAHGAVFQVRQSASFADAPACMACLN